MVYWQSFHDAVLNNVISHKAKPSCSCKVNHDADFGYQLPGVGRGY